MELHNNSFHLHAAEIFSEEGIIEDAWVEVADGIITKISKERGSLNVPVIDKSDYKLLPGFIDLHIHGCGDHDAMDDDPEAINDMSSLLAAKGITGFQPTTVTASWQENLAVMERLGNEVRQQQPGAQALGIYSEGIFFTEAHKGAHDSSLFLPPNKERLQQMIDASKGALSTVAVAAELPECEEIIPWLCRQGIHVSVGHTNATYEQTVHAIELGATAGVHIFNGMSGLHHRNPGCAGAILSNSHVLAEMIADGIHIHPAVLNIVATVKGAEKTALISDCSRAGMMPDGKFMLGPLEITVSNGIARTENGSLAGSTLSLNKAVHNMIHLAGINPLDAVHMASLSPAKHLGIDHKVGSIAVGKQADLVAMANDFSVDTTWVNGNKVYQNSDTAKAA
ncbi:N-acetylglucosamine-6-phosphate deacetylase [invertebrate metagenome]|uniref:N-acetylglucosamine-6-phosphate deacetylase n=1 Tax=invertebrate metagenome TaxID=1711999 RepID=A0A2H9TAN4_9ZZZZ